MYAVNNITYNECSHINQRILDQLVNREVFCCVTQEIEFMIKHAYEGNDDNPITEEDLLSLYKPRCNECGALNGFTMMTVGDLSNSDFINENGHDMTYKCPICGAVYKTIDDAKNCCGQDSIVYKCNNCDTVINEADYNELDTDVPEIFEWWAVSKWFGEKLKEQGCVVFDSYGKSYWGRETTGQSIALDSCVENIAKQMQILDGMENCWLGAI